MGKKSTEATLRMAAGIERLAEIFAQAHARDDRDLGVDEVVRANQALQELVEKRDKNNRELAEYLKRLERDLEQRGQEIEKLLMENDQLRAENYDHRAGLGGLMPPGDKLVIVP
jgi:molybdopterin converting factor small subunit